RGKHAPRVALARNLRVAHGADRLTRQQRPRERRARGGKIPARRDRPGFERSSEFDESASQLRLIHGNLAASRGEHPCSRADVRYEDTCQEPLDDAWGSNFTTLV